MYLDIFSDLDDVIQEFQLDKKDVDNINVLLAFYEYEDYSGYAFVLFERDGLLYEVNGSHCSCYGLEGQWEPEETSVDALRHRIVEGSLGSGYHGDFADDLQKILNQWEA